MEKSSSSWQASSFPGARVCMCVCLCVSVCVCGFLEGDPEGGRKAVSSGLSQPGLESGCVAKASYLTALSRAVPYL